MAEPPTTEEILARLARIENSLGQVQNSLRQVRRAVWSLFVVFFLGLLRLIPPAFQFVFMVLCAVGLIAGVYGIYWFLMEVIRLRSHPPSGR